jgi:hypothetical protein
MAQVAYRANLNAASFPFLSEDFGRSVIVPGQDNNFNRQLSSSKDPDKDVGIPQAYYMHNVLPYSQGFQSVGYFLTVPPAAMGFLQLFPLRDDSGLGANTYMGIQLSSDGASYIPWILKDGKWTSTATALNIAEITISHLQGKTYIYSANLGCIRYDFATAAFVNVVMTGLDTTKIIGITYAAGYMIAWDTASVYWSSTLPISGDIVDFTPSIVTGAGSQSLEAARGQITFCFPHQMGFIAYTTQNAVVNVLTSNSIYPFSARELVASGGLADQSLIAVDSVSANHYCYTTSGMQLVSVNASNTVFPEVTDFISGRRFEDYNPALHEFTHTDLTSPMKKKLTVIASRYLVISYGVDHLTHALVYDLIMQRWGKLRINHVDVIEYEAPNTLITEIPKQSFAFLQDSGALLTVDFSASATSIDSCLVLGKYQFARSRLLQLDTVDVESVQEYKAFQLTDIITLDGKIHSSIDQGTLVGGGEGLRRYAFRAIGMNHTLELAGTFKVNSLTMTFNVHGKR